MKSNKRGVTLIELVVVFAIIALGAVLVVPGMGPWMANYRLRSATRDITSTLRVAQMKAVSNNLVYRVSFDTGARTYTLQRSTGGIYLPEGTTQTLPAGIAIVVPGPVGFWPNSSSNGGSIQLTNTKGTQRTVTVLPSTGRISIQ